MTHKEKLNFLFQRVGHPWENQKVSELVSKILAACPDSLRPALSAIEPFVQPRSSAQWFHCVSFLKKVSNIQMFEMVLFVSKSNEIIHTLDWN